MDKIIQGIRKFQNDVFPNNREFFRRLASGQNPEALLVCCSDSRISLDLITQTAPGDLFVCRNAGNIVPVYGQGDAVSGTIEYAVMVLKVKHIVICGHSDCGAMKGLLKKESLGGMPAVQQWLRHADAARCAFEAEHGDHFAPGALTTLTKMNVLLQLAHLATHAQVFARTREGKLSLHGWYYQIETGDVQAWDHDTEEWLPFEKSPFVSAAQLQFTQPDLVRLGQPT
jgi:carbonic anhydrase